MRKPRRFVHRTSAATIAPALLAAAGWGVGCVAPADATDSSALEVSSRDASWRPVGPTLSPRGLHTLAWDGANGALVLFGGVNAAGNGETFLGEGTWFRRMTPQTAPP